MKRKLIVRTLVYLLIPLVVLEFLLRIIPYPNQYYLSKTDPFHKMKIDEGYVPYIFIGSSHVAAAVDTGVFNNELKGMHVKCINAGHGNSTCIEFYMALKKLADKGLLDHSTVFLESVGGGPASYTDSLRGEWVKSQNVHLLVPSLNFKTFLDFWKYSSNTPGTKLSLSINYLFYTSRITSMAKDLYQGYSFKDFIRKVISKAGLEKAKKQDADMEDKGGIKVDPISIHKAREMAHTYFKSIAQNQEPISQKQLDNSVLLELDRMLAAHNSKLVLFNIPLSTVERQVHITPVAESNFNLLRQFLNTHNIAYVSFDFSGFKDDDFPDLWHLSKEKSKEYSQALARNVKDSLTLTWTTH
jgi:hypothetical protein